MNIDESEIIDYYESHEKGDTGFIPASESTNEDSIAYHAVELYKPDGSISEGLKWSCKRCGRYYADPKHYENDPCIPWEKR